MQLAMTVEDAEDCEQIEDHEEEEGQVADARLHAAIAAEIQLRHAMRRVHRFFRTSELCSHLLNIQSAN